MQENSVRSCADVLAMISKGQAERECPYTLFPTRILQNETHNTYIYIYIYTYTYY